MNPFIQLIPLTYQQLQFLPDNKPALRQALGVEEYTIRFNADFMQELDESFRHYIPQKVKEHPSHSEWYTMWLILHRADNRWIGGVGGTGLPNEKGEIMIGYFMDDQYAGKGYTTQAVALFCEWLRQQGVNSGIYATTPPGHIASEKVLQKNGFVYTGKAEEDTNRWDLPGRAE